MSDRTVNKNLLSIKVRKCMPITRSILFALAAAVCLSLSSCGNNGGGGNELTGIVNCSDLNLAEYQPPAEPVANDSNNHMEIINNDAQLEQYFNCMENDVFTTSNLPQSGMATQAAQGNGSWGRGFSLRLVAEVSPPTIIGKAAAKPGGVSLNDLTSGGTYTGIQQEPPYINYRVEIDGTGPDTFRWSDDNGSTWQASGIAVTPGSAQTLSNGVTVTFGASTGHTVGDYWNIDAGILQATSVSMKGNHAIVSYSMIDVPYLGAIRLYHKHFEFPFLRSQALFRDTDIHAVSVSGNTVYAVGASEPGVLPDPALLEVVGLLGTRMVLEGNNRLGLMSYTGTSVIHDNINHKIYMTSGNSGGLTVVDDASFTVDSQTAIDDARWVHFEESTDTLVVAEGCCGLSTDGQISVYDINGGVPIFQNTFGFAGADIPESKSTVEVVGKKAIIAAGSEGVQVISTVTGSVLASIPIPTAAESGIADPNLRVANAVSVDDDLMFISFGVAGVYVAQADEDLEDSGPEGPVNLTLHGKLAFDNLESVNHVAFKEKHLYIAAGLGGLKIVRVYKK